MKKYGHIILMAMGMLMSMACSSSDDSEQEVDVPETGTPIAFSAQQGEETAVTQGARRASITRNTPLEYVLTSFKVWAFKNTQNNSDDYSTYQTVIPGYYVHYTTATSTTNTDSWDYVLPGYPDQTIKYWDWNAKAYRFFGVAETIGSNVAASKWSTTNEGVYELSFTADATNADDAPYYSKLWFSDGNSTNYPTRLFGQPVLLEFMKPFAKVRFMFTYANTDPDAKKPLLEDPSFHPVAENQPIKMRGTFTVSYPITGNSTTESWSIDNVTYFMTGFTVPYTEEANTAGYHHWETVLPATNQGAFQLTVTINGEDKSCAVPAQYMVWQPGYSYTYIFKVNEEGGVELGGINIAVTNWQEGLTDDYILYNW